MHLLWLLLYTLFIPLLSFNQLLKRLPISYLRHQINNGIPSDDLPRLVCASGRTESAVAKILDDLESRTVDVELVRLWHSVHNEDIGGHVVRGYTLLGKLGLNGRDKK